MRTCNLGSLTMATIFGHTHIKGIIIHNSTFTIIYRPKWSRMRKWMIFTKPYQPRTHHFFSWHGHATGPEKPSRAAQPRQLQSPHGPGRLFGPVFAVLDSGLFRWSWLIHHLHECDRMRSNQQEADFFSNYNDMTFPPAIWWCKHSYLRLPNTKAAPISKIPNLHPSHPPVGSHHIAPW